MVRPYVGISTLPIHLESFPHLPLLFQVLIPHRPVPVDTGLSLAPAGGDRSLNRFPSHPLLSFLLPSSFVLDSYLSLITRPSTGLHPIFIPSTPEHWSALLALPATGPVQYPLRFRTLSFLLLSYITFLSYLFSVQTVSGIPRTINRYHLPHRSPLLPQHP